MLVSLACCGKDAEQARALIEWIAALGTYKEDSLLLIVSDDLPDYGVAIDMEETASKVFGSVDIACIQAINGWIPGANKAWRIAAEDAELRNCPFLWIEPDVVPLRAGWLDEISKAYALCPPEAFLGNLYDWDGRRVLSGIAVYPAQALSFIGPLLTDKVAFDVAARDQVAQRAVDTPLIRHQWGWKDLPPTFVEFRAGHSGLADDNVIGLNQLPPGCALYHRSKDGSLLRLLRAKLFPPKPLPIAVVFPYCSHDAALMLHHLRWMAHLHPKKNATAVVHHDGSAAPAMQNDIYQAASAVFSRVYASRYVCKTTGWPWGPNSSWNAAARYMQALNSPWFFFEPDCCPLKPDWLEQICAEYEAARQPFMGFHITTIVPHSGHWNGCAVYAADTPKLLIKPQSAQNLAFDTEAASEMNGRTHSSKLIHHHLGSHPEFKSKADLAIIPPEAVVFHPTKHGDLPQMLL